MLSFACKIPSSIKTRIETAVLTAVAIVAAVKYHHPLKQGLKLSSDRSVDVVFW